MAWKLHQERTNSGNRALWDTRTKAGQQFVTEESSGMIRAWSTVCKWLCLWPVADGENNTKSYVAGEAARQEIRAKFRLLKIKTRC